MASVLQGWTMVMMVINSLIIIYTYHCVFAIRGTNKVVKKKPQALEVGKGTQSRHKNM